MEYLNINSALIAITIIVAIIGLSRSFYNLGYNAAKENIAKNKIRAGSNYWVSFKDQALQLTLDKIIEYKDGSTRYEMFKDGEHFINLGCACHLHLTQADLVIDIWPKVYYYGPAKEKQ